MQSVRKQEVLLGFLNRINKAAQSGISAGAEGCCAHCRYRFDPMLNRIEAWAYTGFKPGTFAVWDCTKKYDLQPIRIGNAVRYRLSSLNSFGDNHLRPE